MVTCVILLASRERQPRADPLFFRSLIAYRR